MLPFYHTIYPRTSRLPTPRRTNKVTYEEIATDVLYFLWSQSLSVQGGLATLHFGVTRAFENARRNSNSISWRFAQQTQPESECGRSARDLGLPPTGTCVLPLLTLGIRKGNDYSNGTSSNCRRGNRVDSALLLPNSDMTPFFPFLLPLVGMADTRTSRRTWKSHTRL
jgi:hypothetical protein